MTFKSKEERNAYAREYRRRPEVRARIEAQRKTPEFKAKKAAQAREYQQRPEVKKRKKAYMKEYVESPEGIARKKARQHRYARCPEVKASKLEYSRRPEVKARAKAYRDQPHVKARRLAYTRNRHRRVQYGITEKEYEAMFELQDHRCALCGKKFKKSDRIHVDHDHDTGKVRGLLHLKCNLMLGMAEDSIEILQLAINYLLKTEDKES